MLGSCVENLRLQARKGLIYFADFGKAIRVPFAPNHSLLRQSQANQIRRASTNKAGQLCTTILAMQYMCATTRNCRFLRRFFLHREHNLNLVRRNRCQRSLQGKPWRRQGNSDWTQSQARYVKPPHEKGHARYGSRTFVNGDGGSEGQPPAAVRSVRGSSARLKGASKRRSETKRSAQKVNGVVRPRDLNANIVDAHAMLILGYSMVRLNEARPRSV